MTALVGVAIVVGLVAVLLLLGALHNHEKAVRALTAQLERSATVQIVANMRASEIVTASQQLGEALKNLRVTVSDRPRTH